jgi:hypothetical protein
MNAPNMDRLPSGTLDADGRKMAMKQAWLVSARSDVQHVLLDLKLFIDRNKDILSGDVEKEELTAVKDAVDVAFSLWRAVFLIKDQYRPDELVRDMSAFLDMLIDDNAINYPQDKSTRNYSSSYYLTNASLRILRLS